MLGIVLVALGVAAAAYLVLKRFYAPMALLMVGAALIVVMGFVTGEPVVTGKSATNTFTFDVVQVMTNLLKSRAAGLGMNIMVVAGFAAYMDRIGATKSLVNLCTKPLEKIHAPYVLLALAYVVGQLLNVFIPSATGLGMLLMVTLFPLLVSQGVSKYSAAAAIATASALDLGPASGNSLLAAELSAIHVMEYFFDGQLPIAVVVLPLCAIAHAFLQRQFDIKDRALGRLTDADFTAQAVEVKGAAAQRTSPAYYALLPLLPVVLLFVFSKFVYAEVRLELITAILFCCFTAFVVDLLTRRTPKEVVADTKAIFEGMGKVFTSTVILIICAEVFAEGLKRTGGIDAILTWASQIEGAGGVAMLLMMIGIMAVASFVTGSGNAAFFAFSHFLPQCAKSVAWETIVLAAPVQLASGIARSMSPISGVTMAVAGLAGISPFELVRRTLPVMVLALFLTILASVLFV
ncbi:C4-dicarboxylate transporter DcuC [Sutterella parvirubra]|uniref:Putative anaerobic C4-dicarboxylate transporter DcuC n=1 Tax=Sutterella parvirubra YIT 11816 TaxID=762967 RepID=H3KET9_9BURK|nr:C4-dicarboxylate transporter DcuC [Sutterella parvirubra]EHY31365.1 putative anaerobic C4-dicarboxylate transporter DcuC [Sutterella parvirubra YIT 11816]